MSDPKKIVVRKSDEIPYRPGGLPGVWRAEDRPEDHQIRVIEVHHVHDQPQPSGYAGDDLLRRFVPYFVISVMALIILGGVAAILGMVIPMIMALILSVVASFVSIILSLVATIIAGALAAVAITYCQTRNNITKKR
jgi:hypothetical protein